MSKDLLENMQMSNDLMKEKFDKEVAWGNDVGDCCRDNGMEGRQTVREFIQQQADLIRSQNNQMDEITDLCVQLGMPVDGCSVDFLASIIDEQAEPPAQTFRNCLFNIYNVAAY